MVAVHKVVGTKTGIFNKIYALCLCFLFLFFKYINLTLVILEPYIDMLLYMWDMCLNFF